MSSGKLGPVPPLVPPKTPAANGPTSGVTQVQVKTVPNGKPPPNENGLTVRDGDNIAGLSASTWRLVEIAIAEILGTGCLMFFGCMGSIGENLPPLQGALVFGLVVCTIIQIVGHISAAHLNPAVTVIAIVLGKITPVTGLVYFVAETIGGILGFGLLKLLTPCDLWEVSNKNGTGVCTTTPYPSLTETQSLSLEFLATMFLALVVCSVWDDRNADKPDAVPLKFAATITVISIIVGPFTGASMNPIRTLAPSIFNGVWTQHWVYWIGPMSSAFLTSVFYQLVFDRKQPFKPEVAEEVPLTGVTASDSKIMRNLRQSNITTDTKQNNESQSK